MPDIVRTDNVWPLIIHEMWREAKRWRRMLVIDRSNGDHRLCSAGPLATRADMVEFVDRDGSKTTPAFTQIADVSLTEDPRRRVVQSAPTTGRSCPSLPTMWPLAEHEKNSG